MALTVKTGGMRICIVTNGFPFDGVFAYDVQARHLLHALSAHDTDVVNLAWIEGAPPAPPADDAVLARTRYRPSPVATYPTPVELSAFDRMGYDVVVTLVDVVLLLPPRHTGSATRIVVVYPSLYRPLPPGEVATLRAADVVVCLTEGPAQALRAAGLADVRVVPHVVATAAPAQNRDGPRMFVCNAMNYEASQRKGHAALLVAFRAYLDAGGSGVLVMHAPSNGAGVDLARVAAALRLPGDRLLLSQRVAKDAPTVLYSVAHVVCVPSKAEGFGMAAVEALAAGVPVVVNSTTALSDHAHAAEPGSVVVVPSAAVEFHPPGDGFWEVPDPARLAAAMRALDDPDEYRRAHEAAVRGAAAWRARCSFEAVAAAWRALLTSLPWA